MPSIINSDDGVVSGTSGLKTTGGNDGLLNIQSNGSTVVAVTGSGISVTGTVSQTGVSTFAAGTVSAPSITFTGDTNTGIFSPAADTIAFTEGGTEAMRIDSSGNVGIGTSSPNGRLDITSTSAGANTNTLFLTNASSNASTATSLVFGVSTGPTTRNATIRGINTGGNAIDLAFLTSNGDVPVERMRVLNTGNILCLAGGSTTATGTGIAFPATQSASTNANTLDDYEEGSFTPGLTINNSATGITFSIQVGTYTKIGRQVSIYCGVVLTNKGSSSGVARITNLPFTSADFGAYGDAVISVGFIDSLNTASAPLIGLIPRGDSRIEVRKISGGGTSILSDTDLTNSSAIIVGATYFV